MTRDECLCAISDAFNGVRVEAVVGYWNVHVSTTPAREVIITQSFLEKNVHGGGMTKEELTNHIKSIPNSRWAKREDGLMILPL